MTLAIELDSKIAFLCVTLAVVIIYSIMLKASTRLGKTIASKMRSKYSLALALSLLFVGTALILKTTILFIVAPMPLLLVLVLSLLQKRKRRRK